MYNDLFGVAGLIVAESGAPQPGTVVCSGNQIVRLAPLDWAQGQLWSFGDCLILPGLIDLQVNGAGGRDVMEATPQALQTISKAQTALGTTAYLPTVTTNSHAAIVAALEAIADHVRSRAGGAVPLGSHLEGPYIAPTHRGAHPADQVRLPDASELESFLDAARGTLRLLTLAPELPGAIALIDMAVGAGASVSAGHCAPDPSVLSDARAHGLRLATHLFNAMPPLHHRRPGPVGAVLANVDIWPCLIADGAHVDPIVAGLAARLAGPDRLILVSDAISALGMPDGEYTIAGGVATVRDGIPRLPDGTLAGAGRSLLTGLRHLVEWTGWPIDQALKCVSQNPARAIGLDDRRGRLAPGYLADIVVCDGNWNVRMTLVEGQVAYSAI